jgi:tRNA-Thr(GGU) m(6)t(6)A37 methyltransferase TsaA
MSEAMDPERARPGERALPFALEATDAGLVFIGRIRSPWVTRENCPKSLRQARERRLPALVEIDPPWRDGLLGLDKASHVILLTWLHQARRDLIVQRPRNSTEASGVFALRSPVRPNPIGLSVVRLLESDQAAGRLTIDAIDVLDGTPLLDIKPYFASTDAVPETVAP